MKIRAILETETMDPDFKEPFLNGMPFDITESTFDRIVRYASGCTDVQQPDVIAMVIQHSLDNRKELSELLNTCNHTTQMRVLIPVPISSITFINQYQNTLKKALKERIKGTLDGLSKEQRAELLNEYLSQRQDSNLTKSPASTSVIFAYYLFYSYLCSEK